MTTASATYEDDFPAAAGAFNVSTFETADAGSMVGFAGLQVAAAFDLNGDFATVSEHQHQRQRRRHAQLRLGVFHQRNG